MWLTDGRLTVAKGRLVFAADDGASGQEARISDGTASGTFRLANLLPGSAASGPARFTTVGDRLFFEADDGVHGRELFAYDLPRRCVSGWRRPCVFGYSQTERRTARPVK